MKYLVVLLFLVSVVYSHPHDPDPNATSPAIFFDGYDITGQIFDINNIGIEDALECRTNLDTCCSMAQGIHRGIWQYPDNLPLGYECEDYDMYQVAHDSAITMHRRGNRNILEGYYCCIIETIESHRENFGDTYTFGGITPCIKLLNFSQECPPLDIPVNGEAIIFTNGYTHESTATYSCKNGYNLTGEVNRTCFAGEWSGVAPTCEDSCLSEGKEWNDCGSPCLTTCDNYLRPTKCILSCKAGCFCPEGTVNRNGTCISPLECEDLCDEIEVRNGSVQVTGTSGNDDISFTCDDGFAPVGPTEGTCQINRTWSIEPRCRGCAEKLYVMAFTGTLSGGGSDQHHDLFISLKDRKNHITNKTIPFYNRQGNDMDTNKGDLWTFDLSEYDDVPCFSPRSVDQLAIVQSNNDNWYIDSIVTVLSVNTRRDVYFVPLTIDMEANRWIGSSGGVTYKRFDLTKYTPPGGCRPDFILDMMGFPPLEGK